MKKIALLLCILIALSCLSACDIEQTITDRFVSVDTSVAFPIPHVNARGNDDELNRRIQNYYAPVVTLLSDDEYDFSLRHEISREGSCATVRTYVCGCDSEWFLGEFDVYMDGTLYLSNLGNVSWMGDGEFLSGVLTLSRCGYIASPEQYHDTVSCGQMYGEMIRFYELYCGHELDFARASLSYSGTDDFLKAFELFMNFPDEGLYYDTSIIANDDLFCSAAEALVSELAFDPCGMSSSDAKVSDLFEMCTLFMSFRRGTDWEKKCDKFTELSLQLDRAEGLATRDNAARCFVDLYNDCFGDTSMLYSQETELADTEFKFAIAAVSAGFMQQFPNDELFGGEYILHFGELAAAANRYITVFAPEPTALGYSDFIVRLGDIAEYADSLGRAEEPVVAVMNTRDYDFYIRQHDGTQYQHVNCMPTISAMAVKWYSGTSVTPSEVRALFLPESKEGWYMYQVIDALNEYDVPNGFYDLVVDDMLMVLDSGRIILTQMSETHLDRSGHCLVIWGYKRCGDAVRFYCHDPGMSDGSNKYGGYRGDGIVRDRAYIYYIINRFASGFLAVGDFDPEGITDSYSITG